MKKIYLFFWSFFICVCLFAQTSVDVKKSQITTEMSFWIDNTSYEVLSSPDFDQKQVLKDIDTVLDISQRNNIRLEDTKKVKDNYMLYLEGKKAIESEFKAETVETLIDKFDAAMKDEPNMNRKEELNKIYQTLDNYESANYFYDELHGALDIIIKSNNKNKWGAIQTEINQQKEGGFIKYIEDNPYLAEKYNGYYKWLENKYKPKK